ncbi:sensor histidine kinase [Cellulomonas alba]|uniref:histidine kinase n=1 Tax=Cellulomonas alba TaxID=3053467 RepID=A0ABT7SGE8_9CELL|nr:HAMP domain-containing sensor histidine kinase [Cellulomonas alba]MDM7855265.1 HAMP domain-containing sensor histidine kinase [Cellulomonas alba]
MGSRPTGASGPRDDGRRDGRPAARRAGAAPASLASASPRRSRWTLRRRLVVGVVGLVAVVAAAMGVVSTLALRSSLIAQMDSRLSVASNRAANAPDGYGNRGTPGRRPPPASLQLGQASGTVNVFVPGSSSGDTTARAGYVDESGRFRTLTPAQTQTLLDVPTDGEAHGVHLDGLGAYRAVAMVTPDGAHLVTALPTEPVTNTVTGYVAVEVVVAALALLVAGTVGLVLVRRELRPLDRVAATARRVARLPLDRGEVVIAERVPVADTDPSTEVGQVGAALNTMLGHVESALTARHESELQVRQFVADASHELRTPLASIRGYAELVRRLPEELPPGALQAMARVESESERMTGLVEDMLLLARLDAGRPLASEPLDVAVLAIDAVTDAHAAGPEHRWQLDLPEDDELLVVGDDHRLRQVLANLLSNARLHTPAGTTVTVRARRVRGDIVVHVADDGPGIPPELRDRLFQRFTRGDASRARTSGSTGLGLAIVHAVVTAHGGTITVSSSARGATFTVTLPAARVAAPERPLPVRSAAPTDAAGVAWRAVGATSA